MSIYISISLSLCKQQQQPQQQRNQDLPPTSYISPHNHLSIEMMMLRIIATWYSECLYYYLYKEKKEKKQKKETEEVEEDKGDGKAERERETETEIEIEIEIEEETEEEKKQKEGEEEEGIRKEFHRLVAVNMESRIRLLAILLYGLMDGEAAWNNTFAFPPSFHVDNLLISPSSSSSSGCRQHYNYNSINNQYTSNYIWIDRFTDPSSLSPSLLYPLLDSTYIEHDCYFLFCRLLYLMEPLLTPSSSSSSSVGSVGCVGAEEEEASEYLLDMINKVDPQLFLEFKEIIKTINQEQEHQQPQQEQQQEPMKAHHLFGPLLQNLGSNFLPPSVVVEVWDQSLVSLFSGVGNEDDFFLPLTMMQECSSSFYNSYSSSSYSSSSSAYPNLTNHQSSLEDTIYYSNNNEDKNDKLTPNPIALPSISVKRWLYKSDSSPFPVFLYLFLAIILHVKDTIFIYYDSLLSTQLFSSSSSSSLSQGYTLKGGKDIGRGLYTTLQRYVYLLLSSLFLSIFTDIFLSIVIYIYMFIYFYLHLSFYLSI